MTKMDKMDMFDEIMDEIARKYDTVWENVFNSHEEEFNKCVMEALGMTWDELKSDPAYCEWLDEMEID